MAGLPSGEAGLDDPKYVIQNTVTALAQRTQENVEAEHRAAVEAGGNPLAPALQFFFNTIMGGFQTLGNFLEQIIQAITGAAGGTLATLTDFMTGVVADIANALGWLADLVDDLWNNAASVIGSIPQTLVTGLQAALNGINNTIQQVIEGIIGAIRGIPLVGAGIGDLVAILTGYREGVETDQIVQQNLTISSTSSVQRQPAWSSSYPISAVTYPAILHSDFTVYADTVGPATAGTAHSHEIRGSTDNAYAIAPFWACEQNGSLGGFVTVSEDTVFSKFGMVIFSDTAPVPAGTVYFEVYREQPGGSLDRLTQTDISANITNTSKLLVLQWTDFRIVARRGERYLLRIKNTSSPNVVPRLRGLAWGTGVPEIQWETTTAADTNKTSYTAAESAAIIATSGITPWLMLAAEESDIPEARTWADDFNRPELGYLWNHSKTDNGDLVITNNKLSYGGTTNGFQQALYIHPLATDKFKLTAEVSNLAGTGQVYFMCAGGRNNNVSAVLAVGASGVSIQTLIGTTVTVRAQVLRTNNAGKYTFTYDPASKTYNVLLNDQPIGLSWTDSGNLLDKGVQFRYFQIQIQRTNGVNGGQVDNWVIQDN
ncbi:minor tail protein [Mycobacterium phage Netyap]|nr:minor tail protein [Mycobacterium phage Miley16]QSM00934.1 minor tail protein [Mycobacterium phage Netyap]QYW00918.1 minor tail protein [Mycobacterium phage DrSeegs]